MNKRIIGDFAGQEKGPLLIVLGAVHGNEPAGVKALEYTFKMLEVEPITNPSFVFSGRLIGILGNRRAYKTGDRYIDTDLNRIWSAENVKRIKSTPTASLNSEEKELRETLKLIRRFVKEEKTSHCIILDVHTTSSSGGIFAIPGDTPNALSIAKHLNAPVINGMLDGISGTTMHYFNEATLGVPTDILAFESGQHDDQKSINRAIAGIINIMKALSMVREADVENIHNSILSEYSKNLPRVSTLLYKYEISPDETFVMDPGYKNFDIVKKGKRLASSNGKPVICQYDGRIIMPLYQRQGQDGFFIVK